MPHARALVAAIVVVLAACSAPAADEVGSASPSVAVSRGASPSPRASQASAGPSPTGPSEPTPTADPLLAFELVDVRSGTTFTLGELATEKPVLVEAMAIWCTTCLGQQREVVEAHELADFHTVGIDVDPNERAEDLADYAAREGFDWHYAMADAELVQLLTERYGFGVANPPSTPTFIVSTGGEVRALEFGRVRSAEELVAELASG